MLHELALYTANSLDLTRVANVPSIGDQLLRITIYHRLFQYWDLLAGNKTFSPFWNTSCLYKYPFGDQLITNNITENSVFTKNMTAVRIWIALPKSAYNFVPSIFKIAFHTVQQKYSSKITEISPSTNINIKKREMIRKEVKEYSHNVSEKWWLATADILQ
ncbi:hypothetical protein T10_778 [Trichinella papuae]|uniref:Uncharacterized protein n=1 Tax=Trichinella papuae TaxID=268474 RepID=A0A0V1N1F7_9BILA|nr:hypothetical protein T10_778 [Trichinella papuae]